MDVLWLFTVRGCRVAHILSLKGAELDLNNLNRNIAEAALLHAILPGLLHMQEEVAKEIAKINNRLAELQTPAITIRKRKKMALLVDVGISPTTPRAVACSGSITGNSGFHKRFAGRRKTRTHRREKSW